MLEAAGVLDAVPPGPPAPIDLEPHSYYDTPGPDWVWAEPTKGAGRDRVCPAAPLSAALALPAVCILPPPVNLHTMAKAISMCLQYQCAQCWIDRCCCTNMRAG